MGGGGGIKQAGLDRRDERIKTEAEGPVEGKKG